jgi:hypothetical protein
MSRPQKQQQKASFQVDRAPGNHRLR